MEKIVIKILGSILLDNCYITSSNLSLYTEQQYNLVLQIVWI